MSDLQKLIAKLSNSTTEELNIQRRNVMSQIEKGQSKLELNSLIEAIDLELTERQQRNRTRIRIHWEKVFQTWTGYVEGSEVTRIDKFTTHATDRREVYSLYVKNAQSGQMVFVDKHEYIDEAKAEAAEELENRCADDRSILTCVNFGTTMRSFPLSHR